MRKRGVLSPISLREVYAERGEQSAKFIIDPSLSLEIGSIDVRMLNADGHPMRFSFKRWGTKLNLSFHIDEDTPDGVSIIDVTMRGHSFRETRERFPIWIIK